MYLIYIINIIIFNSFLLLIKSSLIVIPYKYANPLKENKFKSHELYSEVQLGNPPQSINFLIDEDYYVFFMGEDTCYKTTPSYYDYKNSSTCVTHSLTNREAQYADGVYLDEIFTFYNTTNLTSNVTVKIEDIYFDISLYGNSKKKICAKLGLIARLDNLFYDSEAFIVMLSKGNIINQTVWTYIFYDEGTNNKYKGLLIFGEYPHEYDKKHFNENALVTFPAYRRTVSVLWDISFDEIYYIYEKKVISHKLFTQAYLEINYDYIRCPEHFYEEMKEIIFKKYLENKICEDNNSIITCNKKKFNIDEIKKFPNLYFFHSGFNYVFNLTSMELFEENENNFTLLITTTDDNDNNWKLGKIFLKKYQFVFDQYQRTISFYKNKTLIINETDETDKVVVNKINNNEIIMKLFWICLCFIFLISGIYIGTKIIKRKKKANELIDDDFEYIPQNETNEEEKNKHIIN